MLFVSNLNELIVVLNAVSYVQAGQNKGVLAIGTNGNDFVHNVGKGVLMTY
ncbi:hypothetical protein PA42_01150 [Pasteurella canis]|uniref:Uncharacterized protein n=1 Tax=Pasteurella canis TaxID=753 RepID=A0ABQ4VD27_9PAST|nr:hypothetical protein PA42_01150 [Pasteurella canis]